MIFYIPDMSATKESVKAIYDEFNTLIFKGSLPHEHSFTKQSCRKNSNSSVFEDRIIHEMIHLYISQMGINDTGVHGLVFRNMVERINRDYGRNVRY